MTLFDGKPLTDQEVAFARPCRCGHSFSDHADMGHECITCNCEKFTEPDLFPIEEPSWLPLV